MSTIIHHDDIRVGSFPFVNDEAFSFTFADENGITV